MTLKIVVVGGVAGGATAAAKARRQNETAQIQIFERGEYISFANCGLPYFIGGEIQSKEALLLTTPEEFGQKYNLQVHIRHEVQRIDRQKKVIEVLELDSGQIIEVPYDRLILAQGAEPIKPPMQGLDQDFVFTLRTIPDMLAIHTYIEEFKPQKAVVVGGGYIGLEMAEAFYHRGLHVTVVEAAEHIMPRLEDDMAVEFLSRVQRERFQVIEGMCVTEVGDKTVQLSGGEHLDADLVLMSVGVRPECRLSREAGLNIGVSGGVKTNGMMQSSDPHIYVVGDMAEVRQAQTGAPMRMPLAGPANRQGRVAGANAAGGHLTYKGALGTSIIRCLETTVGMVGLNTRDAEKAQFAYRISVTRHNHHASYYPGAKELCTMLIVEEGSGRILGAQIMGEAGVDKRLDVISTAIAGHLTVFDLEDLDLAYAPPFGSPNDPINTAAFVLGHELRGDLAVHSPSEPQNSEFLLDVRNEDEFAEMHLPGAVNIPLPVLRQRMDEIPTKQPILIYCQKGQRGYLATRILQGLGWEQVKNLKGGIVQAQLNLWGKNT